MATTPTMRTEMLPVPGGWIHHEVRVCFDGRPAEFAARLLAVLEGARS